MARDFEYIKGKAYSKGFLNRNDVILWDVQPINNEQIIKVTFISSDSKYRQGVRLATDSFVEVNGESYSSLLLWVDTAPSEVFVKCKTNNGLLSIYNIWEKDGKRNSQSHTSGMIIEELNNELIYKCNDIGFETNFDKLVFSIEKIR